MTAPYKEPFKVIQRRLILGKQLLQLVTHTTILRACTTNNDRALQRMRQAPSRPRMVGPCERLSTRRTVCRVICGTL